MWLIGGDKARLLVCGAALRVQNMSFFIYLIYFLVEGIFDRLIDGRVAGRLIDIWMDELMGVWGEG